MRHQIDQRDQQYEFTQDCHDDRANGVAGRHEGHLAGDLHAENEQCPAVNTQRFCGESDQRGVVGEQAGKGSRKQFDQRPQADRVDHADGQQQLEGLFDTHFISRTEIIAADRLRALCDALQRQHRELHDTAEDRHRAHRQISAVSEQRRIKAKGNDAFAALHDKGRHAERDARQQEAKP